MPTTQRRVLFISHGGGPLPLLGDPGHQEMLDNLRHLSQVLPRPRAIIVISAHWEASQASITASASPGMIYDYFGFPPEAYEIEYPCPGAPALAERVHALITKQGIPANLDHNRAFDHGLYVPLKIMYPQADIPCIQISLVSNLDPAAHVALGEALARLDEDNVMIVGSGFSFHNLRAMLSPASQQRQINNQAFEDWLIETCASADMPETLRRQRLLDWETAPHARYCHPREEHLLPLHVCYGVTQSASSEYFRLNILGVQASVYLWA